MNRFFVITFLIFCATSLSAQIHEIGVFLGGSNYIGDIGKMSYIDPNKPAFGILYKWNRSPRHSWRISYTQSTIEGDDSKATSAARKQRGYRFKNDLKEISAGLEFNFFNFNLHEMESQFTPYIYSGVSYMHYDGLFFVGGTPKYGNTHDGIAIPIILGVKGRLFQHFILAFEAGARWSFKDDLDGSNPTNKNLTALKFGNINSTDWYVFTGFTLTYTFGNKPCYCTQ